MAGRKAAVARGSEFALQQTHLWHVRLHRLERLHNADWSLPRRRRLLALQDESRRCATLCKPWQAPYGRWVKARGNIEGNLLADKLASAVATQKSDNQT